MNKLTSSAGLEIIGDLHGCPSELLLNLDVKQLKPKLSSLIKKNKLTDLGSYYHQFDIGVTGVISLAESHVAFHTWPNEKYVSLNVYVCNYQKDNSKYARNLFQDIVKLFKPIKVTKKEVNRSFV